MYWSSKKPKKIIIEPVAIIISIWGFISKEIKIKKYVKYITNPPVWTTSSLCTFLSFGLSTKPNLRDKMTTKKKAIMWKKITV